MKCDRCNTQTDTHTLSYFNCDTICLPCREIERSHPDFSAAQLAERQAVISGDFNFAGVGLPADYYEIV